MAKLLVDDARARVHALVSATSPYDEQEAADQIAILEWVCSKEPLFRVRKPATPPQHLAVYAALLDEASRSVMIVDHVKAQLWLLPGGHVDPGEDPRITVRREVAEELRIEPPFHERFGDDPFFLTITQTQGADSHIDVTLWFVFAADRNAVIKPDLREFSQVRWFGLDDDAVWAGVRLDPQMHRFLAKLSTALDLERTHIPNLD